MFALQLHVFLAGNVLKKPLVVEEFGLTWFKATLPQQRVLFKVGGLSGLVPFGALTVDHHHHHHHLLAR